MRMICTIEDVFDITGRGCVVAPGVPYEFPVPVGIGARLLVEKPSGERIETKLAGLEMINRGKPMNHAPFSVERKTRKTDLPIGSKVFLLEENDA